MYSNSEAYWFTGSLIFFYSIFKYFRFTEKLSWYLLHSYGNLVVIYQCYKPMVEYFQNPIESLIYSEEYYDTSISISILHLFHILAYKCNYSDLFHHITFVLLGSITRIYIKMGNIVSLYHFFICGLPGLIDYLVLSMYEAKYVTRATRLCIAEILNTWIRAPGLIISNTLTILFFYSTYNGLEFYIYSLISYILSTFNGLYYMRAVLIAKYKLNKYKNAVN